MLPDFYIITLVVETMFCFLKEKNANLQISDMMGLCGTFRLTFGTWDFKYIIGTVPQESGRVVTLGMTSFTREVKPGSRVLDFTAGKRTSSQN